MAGQTRDPEELLRALEASEKREAILRSSLRGSFEAILQAGTRAVGCPMLLGDSILNILAWTGEKELRGGTWEDFISAGYAPYYSADHSRFEENSVPLGGGFVGCHVEDEGARRAYLIIDIPLQGGGSPWGAPAHDGAAHLVIAEKGRAFGPEQYALLGTLCQVLDGELRRANTLLPSPRFSAKHLLLQLVNGDLTDEALIRFRADLVGQPAEGCFSLLLVDLKNFHPSRFSISSIQNTLENAARGYSVIRDETLIVLISHASEDERALAPLWEELEGILSANGIWGVYSRRFQRLGELHHHFLQTEKILDLRFCVQEANHLLSYDTMEVFSLVDLLAREGIAPSQPAVEALAGHDGKNGTMYTETLYTYLRCAQRPAEAAKRLFIHRNTLDYRIRRIGELADIDWGDGDLLFRLYLALSSLKYHAYKEGRLPGD